MTPMKPAADARADRGRYDALDMLATMVGVVRPDGSLLFVNAMFENVPACRAAR